MNPSQNNSFGSFGSNSGDFGGAGQSIVSSGDSSGTGLVMSRKRGGKKWLIVVGVVLILLAVGLGVGVVIMRSRQSTESSDVADDYKASFNLFANYVINGEPKTDSLAMEYDSRQSYYIDVTDWGENPSDEVEFYDNVQKYWTAFYDSYEKTDLAKNDNYLLNSSIKALNRTVGFLCKYVGSDDEEKLRLVREYMGVDGSTILTQGEINALVMREREKLVRLTFAVASYIDEPEKSLINENGGGEYEE